MRPIADDNALVGQHSTNGCHDSACAPVLPCIEGGLNEPDSNQDASKGKIGRSRRLTKGSPGNEDQHTSDEEDRAEASEEVPHDPPKQPRRRRRHLVTTIFADAALHLFFRKTLVSVDGEASAQFWNVESMPFQSSEIFLH